MNHPKYPGVRVVSNGNQLVAYHTEARIADAGIFYPITPSTEMGELFQLSFAEGKLNVFGRSKIAIETEGEHAAQGGAIAYSATGNRVVNFTSGQGIVYGSEQYYHAPGKLSTMVLEVAARALTKHALNVHCGHDDIYAALDTDWIMLMGRDAQQAADQALIARKVAELSLTPAMNIQDGFLTSHLERTFVMHEAELLREFLGSPDDVIPCPTQAQRELFGPLRRRVPPYGDLDAPDSSSMRGEPLLPVIGNCGDSCSGDCASEPAGDNLHSMDYYDREFRSGLGYHQPASALAAVVVVAAATGATNSKYVSWRETPEFIAENCTQCMACISACPDTALPNTAQNIGDVLRTAIEHYVSDPWHREMLVGILPEVESQAWEMMRQAVKEKTDLPFKEIIGRILDGFDSLPRSAKEELVNILDLVPAAYRKTNAIFGTRERKNPGSGGLFSIFVSDLCKGCAECLTECGDHQALVMRADNEDLNSRVIGATAFMRLLPETDQKFLGLFDNHAPQDSRPATLRNHLMVKRNYQALVSGDGACAGCGEKSVLRALATLTESYMRPIYHDKADRLDKKASLLEQQGVGQLAELEEKDLQQYKLLRRSVIHNVMGLGGESEDDTASRIEAFTSISNQGLVNALVAVLRQEAFNHRDLKSMKGALSDGMSVMAMGAHTGCNTVYGSTSPSNPHPYPWMNSLFQDGATISWMIGESFIVDHARRSVIPERLTDVITDGIEGGFSESDYFDLCHFTDTLMTDQEIRELPKVWTIGGDGGMGDIGFQNVSKVVLQNRPNVQMLMLDTQVYSNTGGQNSDSSVLPGGFGMNQIGAATQGKLTERKSVAECFTSGHGSPFVAQISMADQPRFYKAILDALEYRGTSFFQCFTTCQPEHGVGDDMATIQAKRVCDSRGMPQFVFNPQIGESYHEAMQLAGNPAADRDWRDMKSKLTGSKYSSTAAHWAFTEARFRRHWKKMTEADIDRLVPLDDLLVCLTQSDVVNRRFLDTKDRAYVPDWGVWTESEDDNGKPFYAVLSRQMVLFCIERRKAWRLLQTKAGVENKDYRAQRAVLELLKKGEIDRDEIHRRGRELLDEQRYDS